MRIVLLYYLIVFSLCSTAQQLIPVDLGWARNSINTVIFRKNSLTTFKDTQFIAFYNAEGFVVLGKRHLKSKSWQLQQTPCKGKVTDAHNSISIAVDGDGYLHMAWNHHGNSLHYCKSLTPGSLQLTPELSMTNSFEANLTYPEFLNLPNGDLLFLYRDGSSGSGNLVINRYQTSTKTWKQIHHNLIDGEKQRNAYWQSCVDAKGTIHLSWVWRESPDVASNHDLCYARSRDGGITWEKSNGEKYSLPITAETAEYACKIPQNSDLINQTSMIADEDGNPFIANYWRDSADAIPQYHVVYKRQGQWKQINTAFRKAAFSLKGVGTKRIPISRPQIIVWGKTKQFTVGILFRDEERNNAISVATSNDNALKKWKIADLYSANVGSWEPTYDISLWQKRKNLHLFVQHTEQTDGEGINNFPPQMIYVLQWKPETK